MRLTDSFSLALLQNWVIIFAMAFGIAGSVLASLLFEWLRRPSPDGTAADGKPSPQHNPVPSGRSTHPDAVRTGVPAGWLALAVAVFVIGYTQGRTRARWR